MKTLRRVLSFASRRVGVVMTAVLLMTAMIGTAVAACTTPAGDAGHVIFNTTVKTMQYCNGTDWINAGAVIANAPQTGCVSPTGVAGEVIYASDQGVVQFCNGQSWVDTACAAKRKPNGSGCGGEVAGTIRYSSTHNELQFCDSTDWVAMGWACANDLTDPVWNSPTTYTYTAMLGQPFGFVPSVSDDGPSLSFSQHGTLPTGITFNSANGEITGTPSALGTYTFTLRATDASANIVERTFTVEVVPAEVVVHIAANVNNVNLQTLFGAADWADAAKTKRVIVDPGVTVGSTAAGTAAMFTGTGRGKDLVIENKGTIVGAGGAPNGGAGGNALQVQQTGVTVLNSGNLYGGGGGGGKGGNGGSGNYNYTATEGPLYSWNTYMWCIDGRDGSTNVLWAGGWTHGGVSGYPSSLSAGGYTYTKGAFVENRSICQNYSVSRSHSATASSSGGSGGNGGRGQGSDGAASSGLAGAAGGTNAGAGGVGGAGGAYGAAGSAGGTGTAGNTSAGIAGSAGGAAGRAITGSGYTVTNTGSILGAY